MPSASRSLAGPTPERHSTPGVFTVPALTVTVPPRISSRPFAPWTSTPTARFPSNRTRTTSVSGRIVRFERPRAGSR